MGMNDDQVLRHVIMGTFIAVDSWKIYLIIRNTLMLRNAVAAPPELDLHPTDYDQMHLLTQYETERFLIITIIGLNIRLAKFSFFYFPSLWKLSGDYGLSVVSRAMLFTAMDNSVEAAVAIPIVFLSSLRTGGDFVLPVLDQIVETVFRGLVGAGITYLLIYSSDNFGVYSMMKGLLAVNALGLWTMAFYFRFLISLDHEHLPNNEVGRTISSLAEEVGYPSKTIYVDRRSPEPNAYYSSALLAKVIIITEPLILSLDAPRLASVVAHELGHWHHVHPLYTYLGQIVGLVTMGGLWAFAYGNKQLNSIFFLDPNSHPFVPGYVTLYFVWPPVRDIIQGIFNIMKTHFEFIADDYATRVWSPQHLRLALVKITTKVKSSPLLDNWFAAWFVGHPSLLRRIRRIDQQMMENQHY